MLKSKAEAWDGPNARVGTRPNAKPGTKATTRTRSKTPHAKLTENKWKPAGANPTAL